MALDFIDKTREELLTTCTQQAEALARLEERLKQLAVENQWLKEQFLLAQHRQFGASSERMTGETSGMLFNEVEVLARLPEEEADSTTETFTVTRRKRTIGQREAQLEGLEIVERRHELPEEERICPCCVGPLHESGEEVRDEVEIIPAKVIHVRNIFVKYGCRRCEEEEAHSPVITTPPPTPPAFPGSLASPSAVSYIMSQKYVEGLPLYRQEAALARLGLDLSRQTMANWMIRGADWLELLYDHLHDLMLLRDIVHADETEVQVINEAGRAATTKSYMWVYHSGVYDGPPIILFDYQETRGGYHAKDFLRRFAGYLQVDCYCGYNGLSPPIILVGCMAHARRKFVEALAIVPAKLRDPEHPPLAEIGLKYINRLFTLERGWKDLTPEERFAARQQYSRPVLDDFKAWLDAAVLTVVPKSLLGVAIGYCLRQWTKLTAYLLDGRLEIDNNSTERIIKAFAIGRNNWLFAFSPSGAKASATIYSLVEMAKAHGLDPRKYLEYLFIRLPAIDTRRLEEELNALLPWADAVQAACAAPLRKQQG